MSCTVTFRILMDTTKWGDFVGLVGNTEALSSWGKGSPVMLRPSPYPYWTTTLTLSSDTTFEYKYVIVREGEVSQWEPLEESINRTFTTSVAGSKLSIDDGYFGTIQRKSQIITPPAETEINSDDDRNEMISHSNELDEDVIISLSDTLSTTVDEERETSDGSEGLYSPKTNDDNDLSMQEETHEYMETTVLSSEIDTFWKQVEELRTSIRSLGVNEKVASNADEKNDKKSSKHSTLWCEETELMNLGDIEKRNLSRRVELYIDSAVEDVNRMAAQLRKARKVRMQRRPIKGAATIGTLLVIVAVALVLAASLLAFDTNQYIVSSFQCTKKWTISQTNASAGRVYGGFSKCLNSLKSFVRRKRVSGK